MVDQRAQGRRRSTCVRRVKVTEMARGGFDIVEEMRDDDSVWAVWIDLRGAQEIAGWGEASAVYARAGGTWYTPGGVRLEVNDDVKLVEDTSSYSFFQLEYNYC